MTNEFVFARTSQKYRVLVPYYNYWNPAFNALRRSYDDFPLEVRMGEEGNALVTEIERGRWRLVGTGKLNQELYETLCRFAQNGVYGNLNTPKSKKLHVFNGFPSELGKELEEYLNDCTWYNRKGYVEIEFRYYEKVRLHLDTGESETFPGVIAYGIMEGNTIKPYIVQTRLDSFR